MENTLIHERSLNEDGYGSLQTRPQIQASALEESKTKARLDELELFTHTLPEETSQQASARRATLRRSINAAKKKRQRVAEKGGEREQVRLQKQALRQDLHRQTETEDARTLRLQGQAMRQDLHRHAETEYAREARLQADRANKESKRAGAETTDAARTSRLQKQALRQDLLCQTGSRLAAERDGDQVQTKDDEVKKEEEEEDEQYEQDRISCGCDVNKKDGTYPCS
ncbi:hypothetical protein THAOC_34826 [Thalassiosira oceanica]|uniref:Uncharacterized protein n=1 Tax=Thalassiosira oceanica TaxID=159749 RepID=K0R1W2_THAOC|nr:hypothetical protein THAOC_34826 [Thalassiosira oceanica]|eukprot:EJK46503.1 hypothetical protein THAOC_34826 [Thalassiosira oceanica]